MRKTMKTRSKKGVALVLATMLFVTGLTGCGSKDETKSEDTTAEVATDEVATEEVSTDAATTEDTTTEVATESAGAYFDTDATAESIVTTAAAAGKVGNWGLGNEYEVQALLTKYGQDTSYLSQAFDMDGFDDDSIMAASAMTYNELGLVKNSYEGAYNYGENVKIIDMNEEGVAMLEDNIFCTKEFAEANPNTVAAFLNASLKGWKYACENPEEAAEIVYKYGSSVSSEHQAYMASEVKKLVETDMSGTAVTNYGALNDTALQQTLDLAKSYIKLDDSTAADTLQGVTLDNIRDASYLETANAGTFGAPEKTDISIQLKWLPQAQFMGYYVALDKGYYEEVGLNVNIVSGGGDIGETTAVYTGQVDFGVTWVSNLIAANAGGMDLLEVAQVFQRSGLVLVYKINE